MQYIQNGVSKIWDLVRSHGSVAVIIFNISRNVLVCVKQFRPGVYLSSIPDSDKTETIDTKKYPPELGVTLEFCSGINDKKKPLEQIATEEVLEECGYDVSPNNLIKIQRLRCAVGISGASSKLQGQSSSLLHIVALEEKRIGLIDLMEEIDLSCQ
ncbi:unnamed protein product [Nezara viridula]|uniref:Nudix hydrolase domain-containing protein n=1 Tax=Nezara viridula TaxID=85310 RepID=A0A9P0H6T4_NEZVI|nr:unnamed protein product [Nezara viridula]